MKDQILHTALEQFLQFGIREMSIQKLVEPLGMSTKTVYKYFRNKEELLEQVLHLYYSQQYQRLENLSATQNTVHLLFDVWYMAIDGSQKTNTLFFKDLHYYYPELEAKIEAAIANKFSRQFIQIIKRGVNEELFRKDIHPEVTLESIYVLYAAIVKSGQFRKFKISAYELLLSTITVYIRGFCTQKGNQELEEYIAAFQSAGKWKLSGNRLVVNQQSADETIRHTN